MGKQRVAPVAGADRDPRYHARPGLRWLPHVSVCQRTARDDRRAASLARHDLQGGDLRTALWRRRSTPCLSPIAPRTSSLAVQTQRRRLPLAPLKGASSLFLENRRGRVPLADCFKSSVIRRVSRAVTRYQSANRGSSGASTILPT